tara:strand:- start:24730 stop:28725 length:3996 start_codon:yes stop_codon:yes gene_type:complete
MCLSYTCLGQLNPKEYILEYLTTKEGLSNNYVTAVISDSLNVKWIGTENGIVKYNGYDFSSIKPSAKYAELKNENIETLFRDSKNNVWIGTKSGGLAVLNLQKNEIRSFNHLMDVNKRDDIRVIAISEDMDGNIWIGTWDEGLFVINPTEEKLVNHFTATTAVYAIIKDTFGNMWFSNNQRLSKYDPLEKRILEFNAGGYITDLVHDKKRDVIWISTSKKKDTKLFFFDNKTQKIDFIDTGVQSEFSKILSLDKYNRLWIGTWGNGLFVSNDALTEFHKIDLADQDSNKKSINYQTILDIHRDKNNITWISTAHGGVVKMVESKGFQSFNRNVADAELKPILNVHSIYENTQNIWIGTLNKGLYKGSSLADLKKIKGIGNFKVNTIYEKKNFLFIGTSEGFYIYDLVTDKLIFSTLSNNKVTSIYLDNHDNLFIGTQQSGLVLIEKMDFKNPKAYTNYRDNLEGKNQIQSNRITAITEDDKKNLWVATYNGLHLFDRSRKIFIHQTDFLKNSIPSVIINSMLTTDRNIWLATPSGLSKGIYENDSLVILKNYSKLDGLNNDFISAMTMDDNQNLWFCNLTEIIKLDAKGDFVNYGEIDGVNTTSFNLRSVFNFQSKKLYFGSVDNIIFFNPSQIEKTISSPNIIFTNLKINNKVINSKDVLNDRIVIEKDFSYVNKITLTHKEKLFSVGFALNDYLGKLNTKYRYKLQGFQTTWVNLNRTNELTFTGLNPGNYKLVVQASRDNVNWSEPNTISIKILPSPWWSPWSITAYLVLIIGAFVLIVLFFNRQTRLKNNLEIIRIEKEKQQDLNDAKLTFFTNISHEFRTPLTLILSPLTELVQREDFSAKISYQLNSIERNTKRLLNLINQLLDFRKADHGLLKLSVAEGNFVRFASEVFLYFKEAAKAKNISYKFKSNFEEINFLFDRNKMEIVLCNLISNAIKYCDSGDAIVLEISQEENGCHISLKDTGLGMNSENLDKIFDRFYQIQSAETARVVGSGLGLSFSKKIVELHNGEIKVKSKLNKGTTFSILLSMDVNLYQNNLDTSFLKTDDISAYTTNKINLLPVGSHPTAHEHSILIIEDNFEIREYLKSLLFDFYDVIEARNGQEGYEVATREMPDLIISDVMMPEKDGITLCKELKNQITTSHIPIILLTARTSTVFEISGLQTGADDYVTKPFNPNVIKARIVSLLENRKKLREHLLNKVRFEPTTSEIDFEDPENAFIQKAILLVEKNLQNQEFGIEIMVNELFMSQSTLYRKIKSLTGLSLTGFIRSIRLKKGAQIILSSDMKLSHVAYEVGFNDYKHFKKSFKAQFNCLPSEYKQKKEEAANGL